MRKTGAVVVFGPAVHGKFGAGIVLGDVALARRQFEHEVVQEHRSVEGESFQDEKIPIDVGQVFAGPCPHRREPEPLSVPPHVTAAYYLLGIPVAPRCPEDLSQKTWTVRAVDLAIGLSARGNAKGIDLEPHGHEVRRPGDEGALPRNVA